MFSPDGRRLLVGASEDSLLLDAETGRTIAHLGALYPELAGAQFAGDRLLVRDLYERWTWRSSDTGQLLADLGARGSVILAPNGSRLITINSAQEFEFGEATLRNRDGRPISNLGSQLEVAFSPDSATFAARGLSLAIRSAADGSLLFPAEGDDVAFSSDGARIVLWSNLGEMSGRLVNARDGTSIAELPEMANDPTDLDVGAVFGDAQFSPDGERLLTAYRGRAMLRDGRSGAVLKEDVYHSEVRYSPDSRWALITDTGTRLLDRDGDVVFASNSVFVGLDGRFSFSQDGRFLLMPEGLGMTLLDLNQRAEDPWPRRRESICNLNREAIGSFGEGDRGDFASSELRGRLRGRPWHPCDWRGLYSLDGWAQMARYWSVRLGLAPDYQADDCDRERRGFGCPARRA